MLPQRFVGCSPPQQQGRRVLGQCSPQQHSNSTLPQLASTRSSRPSSHLWQHLQPPQHVTRPVLARAAPERVQEQDPPASPPARQFVQADALTTMQEEQEQELKTLTTQLPQQEQRLEWLAFWVAAAVAFGAGIW